MMKQIHQCLSLLRKKDTKCCFISSSLFSLRFVDKMIPDTIFVENSVTSFIHNTFILYTISHINYQSSKMKINITQYIICDQLLSTNLQSVG